MSTHTDNRHVVVVISDGGGKVNAARRPIHGADRIARFLVGIARSGMPDPGFEMAVYNGAPAVVVSSGGVVDSVLIMEIAAGSVTGCTWCATRTSRPRYAPPARSHGDPSGAVSISDVRTTACVVH